MGLFDVLYQGTIGRQRDKRDRRHAESREDNLRGIDRSYFLSDRDNQRAYDAKSIQRMVADAKAAGLHPLAALGAQTVGPATTFQSQSYSGGQTIDNRLPPLDFGAEAVNAAQAKLLNKQADLIDMQIADSKLARASQSPDALNEQLTDPKRTTHVKLFGNNIKSNPNFSDAESFTTRYGESELLETILNFVIGGADISHNTPRSGFMSKLKNIVKSTRRSDRFRRRRTIR